MNKTTIYYQPTISQDVMTTIRVALIDHRETMERARDASTVKEAHYFFERAVREDRRAIAALNNAPTVDLDDMERHATR